MLTKIRTRLQQEEGFTLIELLVVILIIGILAAVAIPTFLSQKNKANDSNAQSNLKNAQTVVEAYANGNNGNYALGAGTLSTVLSTDSDANALGSVYYVGPGDGASDDSYMLYSQTSAPTNEVFYIEVVNGQAYYGTAANTTGFPTSVSKGDTPLSSATTTAGWTS